MARSLLAYQLVERQAAARPDATALVTDVDGGVERTTYGELDAGAERLAADLRAVGAGPEVVVALDCDRSVAMMTGFFAVQKAGAALLPLDPNLPAERRDFLLRDAGAAFVLQGGELSVVGPTRISPPHSPQGDGLAYVLYTSGSTGTPKGVLISHGALTNTVLSDRRILGVRPGDRVNHIFAFSFDAAVITVFVALAAGAELHLSGPGFKALGEDLARRLAERRMTVAGFATAVLATLESSLETLSPETLPDLRTVIVGGDVCTADLAARWAPGRRFFNFYGPAEAAVTATSGRHHDPDAKPDIGRPIEGMRAVVLDERSWPVTAGTSGELGLAGRGLARGYLGRPAATAERFVPDPTAAEPGARLYKTGDRARVKDDGRLEFLGRLDAQVKIRGVRVEPGEVEAVLAAHPAVRAAAVEAREVGGERRLIAYVEVPLTPTGEEEDAVRRQLHDFLAQRLPDALVPGVFVLTTDLPLTPNGKIDRRALPAPEPEDHLTGTAPMAPRNPEEAALCRIFGELLGTPYVGVHDDFFELGGHSLLAAGAVPRIRHALDVDVGLRDLFDYPTAARLAAWSRSTETRSTEPGSYPEPYRPGNRAPAQGCELPLSGAQHGLWFLAQLDPQSRAYQESFAIRLRGTLDAGALRRAFCDVLARHETLRVTFESRHGEGVQRVNAPGDPLTLVDLIDASVDVRSVVEALASTPLDLASGPLMRVALLRLDEREHVLFLTLHHIVADGGSMGVFFRELSIFYRASTAGRTPELPPLAPRFADAVRWQEERLAGGDRERHLAFWRRELADVPDVLELPTDRPRPAVRRARGARFALEIDAGRTDALRRFARRHRMSLFMVLAAAWAVVLARFGNSRDLVVGTPAANRPEPFFEPLVGFFVHTLALRFRLDGDPRLERFLDTVRQGALAAYEHQTLPFHEIVDALGIPRGLSHTPLVQTVLALQDAPLARLNLPRVTAVALPRPFGPAKFDLLIELEDDRRRLAGEVEYDADLFDATTVRRLTGAFTRLLDAFVASPGRRLSPRETLSFPPFDPPEGTLSCYSSLSRSERHQIVFEWGAGPRERRRRFPVHLQVAEQARRKGTPDAIAVTDGERQLTYSELRRAVVEQARRLRDAGVGPGSRVGLDAEPSLDFIVRLYAVLETGAAYVPLDPSYPAERLDYIRRDARLGAAPATTDDLIYVLYTSGSTGRPKGAGVTHESFANLTRWYIEHLGLAADDRVLVASSPSFDLTQKNFYAPLMVGATLVLMPLKPFDPRERVRRIAAHGVTVINCTPSAFYPLIEDGGPDWEEGLRSLRRVVLGGEPIAMSRLRPWLDSPRCQARVVNTYGPTECTDICAALTLEGRPAEGSEASVPLGRPITNAHLLLVDRHLRPLPAGARGELAIAGDGVGRGYLGRPAQTAAAFVPHPLAAELRRPGARLYLSGDLVRVLADGELEFLGRKDHQVKLRGFRVELGEIEAALMRHRGVREAVVQVCADANGVQRLVAWWSRESPGGTSEPASTELRAFVAASLPEYMVPAVYVALDALPLTPSGKVDRRALPAPAFAEEGEVAPRNAVEARMAALWSEVLDVPLVGAHSDFFELGGHSLLAARLVERVREDFAADVSLQAFFEAPTVAGLVARIHGESP